MNKNKGYERELEYLMSLEVGEEFELVTGVSVKDVLTHCKLDVSYLCYPYVSFTVDWSRQVIPINEFLIHEALSLLKLCWFHFDCDLNENETAYSMLKSELLAYEYGFKGLVTKARNRKNAGLDRPRIPLADAFIKKMLEKDPSASAEEIWLALPGSEKLKKLYLDGGILYCSENPGKSLTKRAFCLRVEKIRKKIGT